MSDIPAILAQGHIVSGEINLILLIGIAVFVGTVGAKVFQRLRIPQIVGYVTIGIVLGPVTGVITAETVDLLETFNLFALGIIGFLIGGELKRDIFIKYGRQVMTILMFEGMTAFFLVGGVSFAIMIFFKDWQTSLAVAVVFAAICAATDPASTINVLWEYKTRGPITTMVTAIVALDDALALVLYAIGVSVAGVITGRGGEDSGFWVALGTGLYEIFGSLAGGALAGLGLNQILKRIDDDEKNLIFSLAATMLVIGLSIKFHMDVIIATMAMGVVIINLKSRRSHASFTHIHRFASPIYVLFFVLVGARLEVHNIDTMIILLVCGYVLGSVIGKTLGAYWGGAYSRSVKTVKNYLGFCLYPQGGIAVGLLIMASTRFSDEVSSIMLLVVVVGAFILQIIGPIGVKYGAKKAGEIGLNVTEADLIKVYKVGDVMASDVPVIDAGMPLSEVIKIMSETDSFYYAVVDYEKKVIGSVTLEGIRNTFATTELNDWLVALDIMEPLRGVVTVAMPLVQGFERADKLDMDHMPVVDSEDQNKFEGVLDVRSVHRQLATEVLTRQKDADSLGIY
ncbi:MAG: cation:proton antiporter [Phycisphaerae bacterium]|nr:cation:proton antiporter [Phycisphaerae bacterium]